MSKKRKRESEAVAARNPAGATQFEEVHTAEESKKDKSQKKKERRHEKESKQDSPMELPVEVNFAALANISDSESAEELSLDANSVSRRDNGMEAIQDEDIMDLDGPASKATDQIKPNELKPKRDKKKDSKDEDMSTGHLSILSKFEKYRTGILKSTLKRGPESPTEPLHGLHPIPHPSSTATPKVDPNSVLPIYLSQPTKVPTTQRPPFSTFTLAQRILDSLEKLKFTHAFPVQSALLPLLTSPTSTSDLLVSAATGSGKTLSYLLPIISSLVTRVVTRTRAIIIVPTHELANQVLQTAQSLASGTSLRITTAIGTRPFELEKSSIVANDLGSTGADILIATPGRLVEHIRNNPHFTLKFLRWLVVDEADRLLGQSFQEWLEILVKELDKPFDNAFDISSLGLRTPKCASDSVRKVILSATMTRDVGKLAGLRLRRPQLIVVDDFSAHEIPIDHAEEGQEKEEVTIQELQSLPSTLTEHYYPILNTTNKPLVLSKLLEEARITSGILIFTKSNESAARLGRLLSFLNASLKIAVTTGEKRKKEISANTAKFKRGEIDVLISTDLMSRGVDMASAQLVVNYDSPRNARDYIHRVGRTARAGNVGSAWSLVEDGEARWWWKSIGKGVKRGAGKAVKREDVFKVNEEMELVYQAALRRLGEEVRGT